MECNKDEATRAKSIAECKLEQKDIFGARKFALKAQTLYPGLDGISQMLTTLNVYVSAEHKISGEVDWYGVLGVNPSADDETIKKQYRKLALMLHPDKNNSKGADGAFKLISEAWSLLSDKAKRLAYNQRRGFRQSIPTHTRGPSAPSRPSQQKVPTHTGGASAQSRPSQQKVPRYTGGPPAPSAQSKQKAPRHTGGQSAPSGTGQPKVPTHTANPSAPSMPRQSSNCASRRTSAPKSQNRSAKVPKKPNPAPSHQRTDTFWTTCRGCNTQYEYLKIYCDQTLLCHNCQKPFMALETGPPVNYSKSAKPFPWQRQRNSVNNLAGGNAFDPERNVAAAQKPGVGQAGQSSFRYGSYQQGPLSGTGSTEPSVATKVANVHEVEDKLKRSQNESYGPAGGEGCFKKRKLGEDSSRNGMNCSTAQGHSGLGTATAFGSRSYGSSGTYHQPNSTRELTPVETKQLLIVKAQKEIVEKLSESTAETTIMAADEEKYETKESNKENYGQNSNIRGQDGNEKNESPTRTAEQAEKHHASPSADNAGKERPKAVTMDVPDSDFHDFDVDRSESSFAANEVWAAYDDDDGMPRLYALISKVVSTDPFELRINWLNPKTNSDLSNIDCVGSSFYKVCGEFSVGRYDTCTSINAFSQRVNWSKGPQGGIIILPQKGDFWALYRNWSLDWSENTPGEVVHKYDMVMVLNDYSEERGVSVAPLVKVAGFRTIFLPDPNSAVIQRISKEEIFKFSHRVPNHFLSKEEAPNAPEGSVELDPAATPLELLQVITETGGVPVVDLFPEREKCMFRAE